MNIGIITIGDELLIGQVLDTNSAWLGKQCYDLGIPVSKVLSLSDAPEAIRSGLDFLRQTCRAVVITGGLGPTRDDKTRYTLSEYFDQPLVLDEPTLDHVRSLFEARGLVMSDLNRSQAMVLRDCRILKNESGTAPGMHITDGQFDVFALPGVPFEMKHLFSQFIQPWIQQEFDLPEMIYRTELVEGIGESALAELLSGWEDGLEQEGIKLAYLPSPGRVRLRLSITGKDRSVLHSILQRAVFDLKDVVPKFYKGSADQDIEQRIGIRLRELGATISTAESCTGGAIAQFITSVPGSSTYFKGSVVAYANEVKNSVLGVDMSLLKTHGAVSQPVVEAMVKGVAKLTQTEYAVATSGIAGPDGGTEEKPVGTVWVAILTPKGVQSQCFHMGKSREQVVLRSVRKALTWLEGEME